MIEWLRAASHDPHVALDGHSLPVIIKRHARARRMTLRLSPDGTEIRVTIPQWARTHDAVEFARSRSAWLAEQWQKIPRQVPAEPGFPLPYRGEDRLIVWREGAPRTVKLDGRQIMLGGPRDAVPARLERWLRKQAKQMLESDLAQYCARAQLPAAKLHLTNARRRWGSCSSSRVIRVNWRLIMAPDYVRRSVVAHEVAHLIHFDHSPAFHAMLNVLFEGDIAQANSWLRMQGGTLYHRFG